MTRRRRPTIVQGLKRKIAYLREERDEARDALQRVVKAWERLSDDAPKYAMAVACGQAGATLAKRVVHVDVPDPEDA